MMIVSIRVVFFVSLVGIELRAINGRKHSGCPHVSLFDCVNVKPVCSKGKLFINDVEIKKTKTTDKIEVISNNLRINGKFVGYFPPFGHDKNPSPNNWNGNHLVSRAANCKCPPLIKIACINVADACINHKLYINGKKFDVETTDKVVIKSNKLYINDKFIQDIPPFKGKVPKLGNGN